MQCNELLYRNVPVISILINTISNYMYRDMYAIVQVHVLTVHAGEEK